MEMSDSIKLQLALEALRRCRIAWPEEGPSPTTAAEVLLKTALAVEFTVAVHRRQMSDLIEEVGDLRDLSRRIVRLADSLGFSMGRPEVRLDDLYAAAKWACDHGYKVGDGDVSHPEG